MNNPISSSFDQFFRRIDLDEEESQAAIRRACEIATQLSSGRMQEDSIVTGSISRSTAVRGFSDVDIVLSVGNATDSDTISPEIALHIVAQHLRAVDRPAEVSGNAVTVHFKDGPDVDILPALQAGLSPTGDPSFVIPSADRQSWQEYVPERQNRLVRESVESAGSNLLRLIRLAKWWSRTRGNLIPSYEIEKIACAEFSEPISDLPRAAARFFEAALHSREEPSPEHSAIETALNLTKSAIDALESGNESQSITYWRCLLGDKFPAVAR